MRVDVKDDRHELDHYSSQSGKVAKISVADRHMTMHNNVQNICLSLLYLI